MCVKESGVRCLSVGERNLRMPCCGMCEHGPVHCVRTDLLLPVVQVYHTLIGVYISPPNLRDLGLTLPKGCDVKPDIPSAIQVLNNHYDKIDTAKVTYPQCTHNAHTHTHTPHLTPHPHRC